MNTKTQYQKMRMAGYSAAQALRAAKTVMAFEQAEADGLVRIRAEEERENYFSVYGEPDGYTDGHGKRVSAEQERKAIVESIERDGCWIVIAEWFDGEDWQHADSIGMNTGYSDPCSPYQNCYVPDLMRSALNAIEANSVAAGI